MGINLNYNVSAHRVLHDQKMKDMLPIMRDTGFYPVAVRLFLRKVRVRAFGN